MGFARNRAERTRPGPCADRRSHDIGSRLRARAALRPRLASYVWVAAVRLRVRAEGTSVLEHGKRRGTYRNFDAERMDLGNEPPLSVDGETRGLIDRRRISVQWFSGTILTGLCGAALMGGAVFAALDGQTNFATVPERVEVALRGAVGSLADHIASIRKSNRLPPAGESNTHRQVIKVSTTTHVGNRELVRVRPFVRVAGNLALSVSELSANIPPFNPQKMLAEAESPGTPAATDDPGAEPDAEVSFVSRDLAAVLPRAKIAAVLALDEVVMGVRDAANWSGNNAAQGSLAQASLSDVTSSTKMAYAAEPTANPYKGFETRIAPVNITLLPKTTTQTTGGNPWNERTLVLKKGDSIASVLHDLGTRPEDIRDVTAALGARGRDGGVKEGQKLRILLDAKRLQPLRVVIAGDNGIEAIVALSDMGKYVSIDARAVDTEMARAEEDEDADDGTGVQLYQSIYETALRNQVPRPVIDDLIRVYSYDIDFQRKVQPGDSFELLFAGEEENSNDKADVLFASLTTGGETRKFYRYQSPDDNVVDYYDETGKSAKKFLVRKPVSEGIITSPFGERSHPILHITRTHTGVDWGSPTGTPIFASGNGEIEKIGLEGGYGKYIRIRHANGYETAYGHMSAFARNMDEGVHVRQGQVIGYVGSTGLSTGSHLHYEILINGRFVDPMKVKLPRGRVLEGPLLASFEEQRDRLDQMMSRNTPDARVAQSV
jgi:murein DD-endopeptidase MepM/ murein hydrolase activator NlpD